MKHYYELLNFRVIKVKSLPATKNLGSRIKLFENRINSEGEKESKVFSYDYSIGNINEQAYHILRLNGMNPLIRGNEGEVGVFICDNYGANYKSLKQLK